MRSTIFRLGLFVVAMAPVVLAASFSSDHGVVSTVVGSSGGRASSSNFTASVTVGQAMVGRGESAAYQNRLGFWEAASPGVPTAVGDDVVPVFTDQLQNCAPNPFNPATVIRFSLSRTADVRLDIYDLRGRRIERLLDEPREPGFHTLDYRPANLASGVYILEMRAGTFRGTQRLVLLK